jgi:hypothetical protein
MKIIFAGETKRVPEFQSFNEIVVYSQQIFNCDLTKQGKGNLKLFYMDEDDDMISVDCQSDFDQALRENSSRIKFVFAESEDDARD